MPLLLRPSRCLNVHSIWELVLHIAVWDDAALRRLDGKKWQPTGLSEFSAGDKADGSGVAEGCSCDEADAR